MGICTAMSWEGGTGGKKTHFSYCFYPFSRILNIRMDFYSVLWKKRSAYNWSSFSHLFSFVEMDLGMGGLLLGMGWDGGVGDDGAGKQASGVNRLRFPFFSLFGFRAFHLFSSILLCYRLVYFIFRSFCLLFFFSPTSSSNQSLIHIPGR